MIASDSSGLSCCERLSGIGGRSSFGYICWRSVEPREENVHLAAVRLPLRVSLILFLEQRDSGEEAHEVSNEEGCPDGDKAPLDRACDKIDSPPEASLAEVVGVACVVPKAMVDELLLAWGLVSDVVLKLLVPDEFKEESEDPESNACVVEPDQVVAGRVDHHVQGC